MDSLRILHFELIDHSSRFPVGYPTYNEVVLSLSAEQVKLNMKCRQSSSLRLGCYQEGIIPKAKR